MSNLIGRIRRRRVQQRLARPPSSFKPPAPGTQTDVILQRLANASQLGLLLLAVFGYYYTVLPVYQKSLLDEEIAKKTLELRSMEERVSHAEALLASREEEFRNVTNRLAELKTAADEAREGLGRARTEVGKLRGTVQSQYLDLRPRLLRDFQSLAISQCKATGSMESGFAQCVERKVLHSPVFSGFDPEDRARLLQVVRRRSSSIDSAWAENRASIVRRKQDIEAHAKDAQLQCEQSKNTEDYKDRVKKISIDFQCDSGHMRFESERLKILLDDMYAADKVLGPHLSAIVREFTDGS